MLANKALAENSSPSKPADTTRWAIGLLFCTCLLFLILNRGAYQSYFQDDELDNLSWAPGVPATVWLQKLFSPRLDPSNFRPVGHFYFFLLGNIAKLHFTPYVAVLHALHFGNIVLVWLVLRRLRLPWLAAVAGAALFGLNVGPFDACWKPMYVFDVLCTAFCLLSLLLYMNGRWVLSLASFWLAYKAKELAVMLPALLLCYEVLLAERRWKRLVPFFAVSLSFGIQGLLSNSNHDNEYTFRFTADALQRTIPFYARRLLVFPWSGLAVLLVALLMRDRRAWFGAAAMCLFLVPLIFLPGRMYPAYVYLPAVGAATAIATAFATIPPAAVLVFFIVWLPWNIRALRVDRRATLAASDEVRAYVIPILDYARSHPNPPPLVFENRPASLHGWGIVGAVNLAWHRVGLQPQWNESTEGRAVMAAGHYVLMHWNYEMRTLRMIER